MEVVGDSIEGVEVLVEAHRQGLTRRSPKGEAHAETINGACIDMIWRSKDHHGAVFFFSIRTPDDVNSQSSVLHSYILDLICYSN